MSAQSGEARRLVPGKLRQETLDRLLRSIHHGDSRVVVGPGVGEDAAVIEFGETCLVAKTDPVTFATDLIGWYAVQVNANDVAASGGEPKWFLATVFLPPGQPERLAETIFEQIRDAASELDVALVGGHTEVTVGLPRPIVSGVMLGEADCARILRTSNVRPGDAIVFTKGMGIEGTSVLARERRASLCERGVTEAVLDRAAAFLFRPGISVIREARLAREVPAVHALHDPTEGGVATALRELAFASHVGLEIDESAVPVLEETRAICRVLGVDPWGLIASGALLISVGPSGESKLLGDLHAAEIDAEVIGHATGDPDELTLSRNGKRVPLPHFDRDELARVLDQGSE